MQKTFWAVAQDVTTHRILGGEPDSGNEIVFFMASAKCGGLEKM